MRYLVGFVCVCALGVVPLVGCSETTGDGGNGGSGGTAATGGLVAKEASRGPEAQPTGGASGEAPAVRPVVVAALAA